MPATRTLLVVAALALTGCGSNHAEHAQPTTTVTVTSTPATPTPTPTTKATAKTAAQIATAMKPLIRTVSEVVIWNEDNDPNKLHGWPNQYTSAATLIDDRILLHQDPDFPDTFCTRADPGVDCGATVEVFATVEDANARSTRIRTLLKDAPWLGLEYHTQDGPYLLRVIGALPPKVNRQYVAAFRKALTS